MPLLVLLFTDFLINLILLVKHVRCWAEIHQSELDAPALLVVLQSMKVHATVPEGRQ